MKKISFLLVLFLLFSCQKPSKDSAQATEAQQTENVSQKTETKDNTTQDSFKSSIVISEEDANVLGFNKVEISGTSPTFTASTLGSIPQGSQAFKGKYVFLTFFATWCPHCQKELPKIDTLAGVLKDSKDIVFLNVSVDKEDIDNQINLFIKQYSIKNLMIVKDTPDRISMKNFNISSVPTGFLIDPNGKVLGGFDGEFDWESKIPDFKNYFKIN